MADSLARLQLARAANSLNRAAQSALPPLLLVTDDERLPDPVRAVRALPPGSLVIVRSKTKARRSELAATVRRVGRQQKLKWTIADDALLAAKLGADGVHFPERSIAEAADWRARRPHWFITCAAHSLRACARASVAGADAVLLAPVFPTRGHPDRPHLGHLRARSIAGLTSISVYALGGIDPRNAVRLANGPFSGLAAVSAWGD